MRGPDPRPRTRGAPKVTGVSYRVKASRRSPSGGMWVAVMASVDGHPARLIGVELGPDDLAGGGWSEMALRAAVVAAVGCKSATLTIKSTD